MSVLNPSARLVIPPERAEWLTETTLDPTGRVFRYEGEIYRAIYPRAAARVQRMLDSGVVKELVERGLLIDTELTDFRLEGFAMVLRHRRVPFLTAAAEWPRSLLRDAGLCWIDLNLVLLRHGLATVDAHWGNMAQIDACRPVWIDFGSIAELTRTHQALPEFRRFYRNPLQFAAKSAALARLTRAFSQTGGLNDYEWWTLRCAAIPVFGRLIHSAGDQGRRLLGRIAKAAGGARGNAVNPAERERILTALRTELEEMEFPEMRTTWGDYHPQSLFSAPDAPAAPNPRKESVLQTIERLQPKRVIDLAGNAGFYSFFAAKLGAETLSTDFDEAAADRLYRFARTTHGELSVTCACYDVTRPVYPRGMKTRKADLVLALALTHHLALGQGNSFEHIGALLAGYSTDALLVEFMPNGLGGTTPQPDPLPAGYTLEHFLRALRPHFEMVDVIADHKEPQWRTLILCRGRKESDAC